MAAGLQLYSLFLLLLVIDFPDQLETINCKSTNKKQRLQQMVSNLS